MIKITIVCYSELCLSVSSLSVSIPLSPSLSLSLSLSLALPLSLQFKLKKKRYFFLDFMRLLYVKSLCPISSKGQKRKCTLDNTWRVKPFRHFSRNQAPGPYTFTRRKDSKEHRAKLFNLSSSDN